MLDVYYDQLRSVFVVTSSPVTMSVLVFLVTPKITQLIAFTALLSRTIVYGILWPWSPPPNTPCVVNSHILLVESKLILMSSGYYFKL